MQTYFLNMMFVLIVFLLIYTGMLFLVIATKGKRNYKDSGYTGVFFYLMMKPCSPTCRLLNFDKPYAALSFSSSHSTS